MFPSLLWQIKSGSRRSWSRETLFVDLGKPSAAGVDVTTNCATVSGALVRHLTYLLGKFPEVLCEALRRASAFL